MVVKSINGGATFSKPRARLGRQPVRSGDVSRPRSAAMASRRWPSMRPAGSTWPGRVAGMPPTRPRPTPATRASSSRRRRRVRPGPSRARSSPTGIGHQLMPAMTFHGGKLRILYYDLREDVSQLFGPCIDELPILTGAVPRIRHTIDVFVAQASPGGVADVHHGARLGVRQRLPAGIDRRAAAAVQPAEPAAVPSGRGAVHGRLHRSRPGAAVRAERQRHLVVQHRRERQRRVARGVDRQPRRAPAGRRQLGQLHAGHVAGARRA